MNEELVDKLFEFIHKNSHSTNTFLFKEVDHKISTIALLDFIAEERGINKIENGKYYNQFADKRDKELKDNQESIN